MKRKMIALSMALFVFTGSSMTAQAAVCPNPNSPGGVHYFNSCRPAGYGGRIEDLTSFVRCDDDIINGNDCKMTQGIQYCRYVCFYCGLEYDDGAHEHRLPIRHSVSRK